MTPSLFERRPALLATLLYTSAALVTTWPLARGLTRDVPWDLGDPVLNCWILGRNAEPMLRFSGGDASALRGFWSAGIFHPEPLGLARSEHLLAQTLQALPVIALTGNVVLAYNLLFLSTFVLSGLGAFLLVRELTGSRGAALFAGFLYGFAPYRVEQLSHLQILSSQWMPYALLGVRRHLSTGRPWPLVGAGAAWLAQNLSCGYYLLFFSPFLFGYTVWERGRATTRSRGQLLGLLAAASAVTALSLPFLWPYWQLRQTGELLRERWEVELFSADVWAFATAPEGVRLWGELLQAFPRPEANLFPGLVPLAFGALGVLGLLTEARRAAAAVPSRRSIAWRVFEAALFWIAVSQLLAASLILAGAGGALSGIVNGLSVRSLPRATLLFCSSAAVLLVVSPRTRAFARAALLAPQAFWLAGTVAAAMLCLGPTIRSGGGALMEGPYTLLYPHVPGFEGLRVPARFGMLVALFLSILAGFGALAAIERTRWRGVVLLLGTLGFLGESTAAPLVLNDVWSDSALRRPPPSLAQGEDTPAVYRHVARLKGAAVLIEFPFGSDPYELRYMFHALSHRRPLVNGFSGAMPASYRQLRPQLRSVLTEPDRAWQALCRSTATHAVVHEGAWGLRAKGRRVSRWLEAHAARLAAAEGSDVLYELPLACGSTQ